MGTGSKCVAPNCGHRRGESTNLNFHTLPKDETRKKKWVDILQISPAFIARIKTPFVCSDHFKASQFSTPSKIRLKSNALPFRRKEQAETFVPQNQCLSWTNPIGRTTGNVFIIPSSSPIVFPSPQTFCQPTSSVRDSQIFPSASTHEAKSESSEVNIDMKAGMELERRQTPFNSTSIEILPQVPVVSNSRVIGQLRGVSTSFPSEDPLSPDQPFQNEGDEEDFILSQNIIKIKEEVDLLDPRQECLMCSNSRGHKLHKVHQGRVNEIKEIKKVLETFLIIMKMKQSQVFELYFDKVGEDEEFLELPFCKFCLQQIMEMVNVYDEMISLHELFKILRTKIAQQLATTFSGKKSEGKYEKSDFYKKTASDLICHRILSSSKCVQNQTQRVESDSNVEDMNTCSKDDDNDKNVEMDFEDDDFDLNMEEELHGSLIEPKLEDVKLKLPVPIQIDCEVELEFEEGRKGEKRQRERQKWKVLNSYPTTKLGLEKLVPLSMRRIKCPICLERLPPLALSKHFEVEHSDYDEVGLEAIKEKLLSISTEMIEKKEREKIMAKKWNQLSNITEDENGVVPTKGRRIKCSICSKEMKESALDEHMAIHTGEKRFQCPECGKCFARQSNLSDHRAYHVGRFYMKHMYFCDLCGPEKKFFKLKGRYVRHILEGHSESPEASQILYFFNCDANDCLTSYRRKEDFKHHLKTHGNVYTCDIEGCCEKIFSKEENLKEHLSKIHGSSSSSSSSSYFDCKYCPDIFDDLKKLSDHEKTHGIDMIFHQSKQVLCDKCGKGFDKMGLAQHKNLCSVLECKKQPSSSVFTKKPRSSSVMDLRERSNECQICQKKFLSAKVTHHHLLDDHTYDTKLYCYICNQEFFKIAFLDSHIRRHLGQPKLSRDLTCAYCRNEFPTVFKQRQHYITIHRDEYLKVKQFYCPICWLRFENEQEIPVHYARFHEHMKCKTCGRQFRNKMHLQVHERIHSGEKPHQCSTCSKKFSFIGNLREHEWRHSGVKPFPCNLCEEGFLRKKMLKEHMEKNHSA